MMGEQYIEQLVKELSFSKKQVKGVLHLIEEGNTVPFIARYRKERTGNLDEVAIREIVERFEYVKNLEERKQEVLRLIGEQGKLTDDLKEKIEKANKLQIIEDLYRPYRQKRRTKATEAKEKGLEPLAKQLLLFKEESLEQMASPYINIEKEVHTIEEALQGAQDIIAEMISDDVSIRNIVRFDTRQKGTIQAKVKDESLDEKKIYELYYEHEEKIQKIVPHRTLAINRGEKEKVLKVSIHTFEKEIITKIIRKVIGKHQGPSVLVVKEAILDSYKRLIAPSIEREMRKELTEEAEEQAISIFALNLKHLLLQPPLKGKMVLGVDPAFRTGCKLAVVDETGKFLKKDVIYPHPPVNKKKEAKQILSSILRQYPIEMVAIGNGTASRETEQFVSDVLKEQERDIYYCIVNEAGASVYSASDLAREEFPDLQVEERSAISIARRLQDPLAELVKIDPKSVGIGQYQHDVSKKRLNDSLNFVVETVVNQVGVDVNTASVALLQYVSGLTKPVAKNIVKYREENGKFTNRKQLKKVPRLGAKTFEQCIGFLRIIDGDEPLDRTAIHPESYPIVNDVFKTIQLDSSYLGKEELKKAIEQTSFESLLQSESIGELTLTDILDALIRPERDPRDEVVKPLLRKDILQLEDLTEGMELEGTVRNVVDFGAFIDIGLENDGLVHVSKMSERFVRHPSEIVHVGDIVRVYVLNIDAQKQRVSLTMVPIRDKMQGV